MPSHVRPRRLFSPFSFDLAVLLLFSVLVYLISLWFDLGDRLDIFVRNAEYYEVDELIIVFVVNVPLLSLLLWRQRRRTLDAEHLAQDFKSATAHNQLLQLEIETRARAEAALAEQVKVTQRQLAEIRLLYEKAPIGLAYVDTDLRFVRLNDRLAEMNGVPVEASLGQKLRHIVPELADQLEPLYLGVMLTGQPVVEMEVSGETKQEPGVLHDWIVSYHPIRGEASEIIGVSALVQDVTERKKAEAERKDMEAQLHQGQRLDSLGLMVGGVSHDFNNIMVVIQGNLQLAIEDASLSADSRECLTHASQAATRAVSICQDLLTFAGRGKSQRTRLSLLSLAESTIKLLSSTVPRQIELALIADPRGTYYVDGDEAQLFQVLFNLVLNATEAIGKSPGRVEIHLSIHPESGHISLFCEDDGPGMDQATQERVFDPFFSTKPKGRGLGLATVQGIVKQHGGVIVVRSAPGLGTTFLVTLPAARVRTADVTPVPRLRADQWKILLADDDPTVCRVTALGFESRGAFVTKVVCGEDLCKLHSADPGSYNAAIVDCSMPGGISGAETYRRLRRVSSQLPVILISGCLDEDSIRGVEGDAHAATMHKPISIGEALCLLERLQASSPPLSDRAGFSYGNQPEETTPSPTERKASCTDH